MVGNRRDGLPGRWCWAGCREFIEREQKRRSGVLQHKSDPLAWSRWVEWYIGSVCLPYAEQPGNHLRRAVEKDAYQGATSYPGIFEPLGDPICGLVQFAVGDLPTFASYRYSVWKRGRSTLDQLKHAPAVSIRSKDVRATLAEF